MHLAKFRVSQRDVQPEIAQPVALWTIRVARQSQGR
jgi:hypothetical protein